VSSDPDNNEQRLLSRMQRPEAGWPECHAGDVLVFDASGLSESSSFRFAAGHTSKFAVVLATPHPDSERVEIVFADSFKPERLDHLEALECGTHVAIEGADAGGPVAGMKQRALVDCTLAWPIHRHRLGASPKKLRKRTKGNVGEDVLDRIRAARVSVMYGRADLDRFHDAIARRRLDQS
jgi:hypothetical protein